jgi:hypothetical protein
MAITRRLKSPTQPRRKKPVVVTAEMRERRRIARLKYKKNRTKILQKAKLRRKKLTLAEKIFNKKRALFLRKTKPKTYAKSTTKKSK